MAYQLVTLPVVRRSLRRLPSDVRAHLIEAMQVLCTQPLYGEALKQEWHFLRSFHTRYKGTDYRVVYEVDERGQQIILRYAASRENFYRKLHAMNLKPVRR